MAKRVEWVHEGVDCKDRIVNESPVIWASIKDELENALIDYKERCGLNYPVAVASVSPGDKGFKAVLILTNKPDEPQALLKVEARLARKSVPVTVITVNWEKHESFKLLTPEQEFRIQRCVDGAPVIEGVEGLYSVETVARRILEPMLFRNV